MEHYFASALGALILLCLSVLISQMRVLNTTLVEQGKTIVKLATVVGIDGNGLMAKMEDLHAWKNSIQASELADAHAEIQRMRDEERRHGPADRRDV